MIYECDVMEILRTEMRTGSRCDSLEFGDFCAFHFVVGETPVFRTSHHSADLMPLDSIIFNYERPYTILNGAPSLSVVLSIRFKKFAAEIRA